MTSSTTDVASAARWSMGILNDPTTHEVPGSILLLSKASAYNAPLGYHTDSTRESQSSLPQQHRRSRSSSSGRLPRRVEAQQKRTPDGQIVLEPQPDDSLNDPLNWKIWRRDAALMSLGFYCMLGGGMTPILAAGYEQIASNFDISESRVALTTGLYMLGLGVGSVFLSPTAMLFGKRPVYLIAAVCFLLTAVWCALSPTFSSLVVARVFMGIAVSSVECLPSATIAEIYFLHEKGYRLGIYTLLLLGGKNLVPLVSAAIIGSLGWRWVFWIVAIVVGFGACLLFFFVPETFWDRTPEPRDGRPSRFSQSLSALRSLSTSQVPTLATSNVSPPTAPLTTRATSSDPPIDAVKPTKHAHFLMADPANVSPEHSKHQYQRQSGPTEERDCSDGVMNMLTSTIEPEQRGGALGVLSEKTEVSSSSPRQSSPDSKQLGSHISRKGYDNTIQRNAYTMHYRSQPPKSYLDQLQPWSGRLRSDNWLRVAVRPFILFAYPSILWSTLVYSLSIGWLIVLSESVSYIYENRNTYNFTALQTGLVYISPFVGGILGTAVAGKCSDYIVRYMARKNGGIYEPEFRLVMAIPITIFTTIGLMGYGWSAQERDFWFVPTLFFGFISFGCSIGSTTAITFAIDSYRQFAGEALVTLNFSKNIFHGMVFSFFFVSWLQSDGSREVFIIIGAMQFACMLTTIPMYMYGKRARMWTVRKDFMRRFD